MINKQQNIASLGKRKLIVIEAVIPKVIHDFDISENYYILYNFMHYIMLYINDDVNRFNKLKKGTRTTIKNCLNPYCLSK